MKQSFFPVITEHENHLLRIGQDRIDLEESSRYFQECEKIDVFNYIGKNSNNICEEIVQSVKNADNNGFEIALSEVVVVLSRDNLDDSFQGYHALDCLCNLGSNKRDWLEEYFKQLQYIYVSEDNSQLLFQMLPLSVYKLTEQVYRILFKLDHKVGE